MTERQVFETDGIDTVLGILITAQAVNAVVETAITTVRTNMLELVLGHQTYNSRAIIIANAMALAASTVQVHLITLVEVDGQFDRFVSEGLADRLFVHIKKVHRDQLTQLNKTEAAIVSGWRLLHHRILLILILKEHNGHIYSKLDFELDDNFILSEISLTEFLTFNQVYYFVPWKCFILDTFIADVEIDEPAAKRRLVDPVATTAITTTTEAITTTTAATTTATTATATTATTTAVTNTATTTAATTTATTATTATATTTAVTNTATTTAVTTADTAPTAPTDFIPFSSAILNWPNVVDQIMTNKALIKALWSIMKDNCNEATVIDPRPIREIDMKAWLREILDNIDINVE